MVNPQIIQEIKWRERGSSKAWFPSHDLLTITENAQSDHLEFLRLTFHVWRVTARLAGKFHVSNQPSQIYSVSLVVNLEVTQFCSINSIIHMSLEITIRGMSRQYCCSTSSYWLFGKSVQQKHKMRCSVIIMNPSLQIHALQQLWKNVS